MWQQEDDMIKDEDELLERDIGAAILFSSFDKYIFVWKFYKGFFKFWLLPI